MGRLGRCGCLGWVELLGAGLAVVAVNAEVLIWKLAWVDILTLRLLGSAVLKGLCCVGRDCMCGGFVGKVGDEVRRSGALGSCSPCTAAVHAGLGGGGC